MNYPADYVTGMIARLKVISARIKQERADALEAERIAEEAERAARAKPVVVIVAEEPDGPSQMEMF